MNRAGVNLLDFKVDMSMRGHLSNFAPNGTNSHESMDESLRLTQPTYSDEFSGTSLLSDGFMHLLTSFLSRIQRNMYILDIVLYKLDIYGYKQAVCERR